MSPNSDRPWTKTAVCGLLVVAGCAAPRPDASKRAGDAVTTAASSALVHGSLASRYRGRFGGGDHDQDAYSVLSVDVGSADRNPWNASAIAEVGADVDGSSSPSSSTFGTDDARGDTWRSRVYEAWVQKNDFEHVEHVRLGRQTEYETPAVVTYDGLDVLTRELGARRVRLGAYGGVPARFDSAAHEGDLVVGGYGSMRPWTDAVARLDWMHVEDERYFGHASDDVAAIDVRQRFGRTLDVDGNVSTLNGRDRDARLSGSWSNEGGDFVLRASAYRLLETQNQRALEFDPFTSVLLQQFPYTELRFTAAKDLGRRAHLELGFDARRVDRSDDEGPFNRDFEHAHATGTLDDVFSTGVSVAVTDDEWNSGTDESHALGVDLSHAIGKRGRVSVGSEYSLYKYDLFQLEERDHVRTYYVAVRLPQNAGVSFDARFEHEDAFRDHDMLRLGVTWWF